MASKSIIKDVRKISELEILIFDVILVDDEGDADTITHEAIINEAKYLLKCYQEPGHVLYEGKEENLAQWKTEISQLKKFVTKWEAKALAKRDQHHINANAEEWNHIKTFVDRLREVAPAYPKKIKIEFVY